MSMELISREEVKKLLNEGWYSGVYPSSAIMSLPTVKAIPLERVEQIRAELLKEYNHYEYQEDPDTSYGIGIAIDIIDKAIKEHTA